MGEGLVLLHYRNVFTLDAPLVQLLKVEHAILHQLLPLNLLRPIIRALGRSRHVLRVPVQQLLVVQRVLAQVPDLRTLVLLVGWHVVVLLRARQYRPVGYVRNAYHAITGQALDAS